MSNFRPAVISSTLASTLRAWRGSMQRVPRKESFDELPHLELYEFEACPFCRFVREAISELQLNVTVYPCPKGGRYRERAFELAGGKTTFPFLVDHTAGVKMAESADIIEHLWTNYGKGKPPGRNPLSFIGSNLASVVRLGKGGFARDAAEPEELLTLYSFESSPFCRLVRERMAELQIPYHLISVAKEQKDDIGIAGKTLGGKDYQVKPGGRREHMIEVAGKAQVPYLIDPNTGTKMFESGKIVRYLEETYAR